MLTITNERSDAAASHVSPTFDFVPVPATAAVGDACLRFSEIREVRRERVLLRVATALAGAGVVVVLAATLLIR